MIEVEVRHTSDLARPFDAYVGGRYLCTSATPFRDSAILLMAEGRAPDEVLVMLDADRVMTLQAPLGYVGAYVTPRFVRWDPL